MALSGAALAVLILSFISRANAGCAAGPSCPLHTGGAGISGDLHVGGATSTCQLKGYNKAFAFFDGTRFQGKWQAAFQFPSKGLYTLAKITKDETDCCIDLEVQAFMCEVLQGGSPVSLPATTTYICMTTACIYMKLCVPAG